MSELRKVILPVDGSENSKRAFSWYMDHLRRPNDQLVLFHACEVPLIMGSAYPFGAATLYEDWQKQWLKHHEDSKSFLDNYQKQCESNGVSCKVVKNVGNPGEEICRHAKQENAACIVMGSRGLGTIRRTILGSVSHYVLHHTPTTVSVVPPEDQA